MVWTPGGQAQGLPSHDLAACDTPQRKGGWTNHTSRFYAVQLARRSCTCIPCAVQGDLYNIARWDVVHSWGLRGAARQRCVLDNVHRLLARCRSGTAAIARCDAWQWTWHACGLRGAAICMEPSLRGAAVMLLGPLRGAEDMRSGTDDGHHKVPSLRMRPPFYFFHMFFFVDAGWPYCTLAEYADVYSPWRG